MISAIAAIGRERVLGNKNDLLWRIPGDLKRFKTLTTGHPVILGRKTFDSIGRALPNRTNIVITRDSDWEHEGVMVVRSLEEAFTKAAAAPGGDEEIFIIGGGQIYEQAFPFIERLYLTLIEDSKKGDAYFPAYEENFTKLLFHEDMQTPEGLTYRWLTLEK